MLAFPADFLTVRARAMEAVVGRSDAVAWSVSDREGIGTEGRAGSGGGLALALKRSLGGVARDTDDAALFPQALSPLHAGAPARDVCDSRKNEPWGKVRVGRGRGG